MAQDRRHFQRIGFDSPLPVLLDQSSHGLVIDVSESGLAVCELESRAPGDVLPFLFDLPEGNGRVEGRAEIVWKNDSVHRTGLRFLELARPSREQLGEWISSRAWTMRMAGVEREYPEPADVTVATPSPDHPDFARGRDADAEGVVLPPMPQLAGADSSSNGAVQATFAALAERMKSGRAVGVGVVAILLLTVSGFLLYSHSERGVRSKTQPAERAPAESASETPSPTSTSIPSAAPAASLPSTTEFPTPAARPNAPGVVLQVGAMLHEANATALVSDLRRKNLPAFVLPRQGDDFYRVVVGPYPGGESSLKVMDQLQKQGLKSLIKPWVPK
jgi:cell division septation protein DedD